jgi:phosphopantetheinyl transferase
VVLAQYIDADPRRLVFQRDRGGKPRLADDGSLFFNLSHSEDVVAVAVTRIGEVGIDVEARRTIPDVLAIARALMTGAELASLERLGEPARSHAFLEWWTQREAVAKAIGVGIVDLKHLDAPAGLELRRIEPGDDCVAAIAFFPRTPVRTVVHVTSLGAAASSHFDADIRRSSFPEHPACAAGDQRCDVREDDRPFGAAR